MTSSNKTLIWLVEHHSQSAYVLAIQIVGNVDDAKDVVQQSYAKVMQQKSTPSCNNELLPWFKRIVRNTAIDVVRSKAKWQKKDQQLKHHHELTKNEKPLCANIEVSERKELLNLYLMKLNPEQRELIVLRDYHDFSYENIAKILDIPKGTVMSRLHRARMALRAQIKEYSRENNL